MNYYDYDFVLYKFGKDNNNIKQIVFNRENNTMTIYKVLIREFIDFKIEKFKYHEK